MPARMPRRRARTPPRPTLNVPVPIGVRVAVDPEIVVHHGEPRVRHEGHVDAIHIDAPETGDHTKSGRSESRGHGEQEDRKEHREEEHDLNIHTGNHSHEGSFDPSSLSYVESRIVRQLRLPARMALPPKLSGQALAETISKGIDEEIKRAELGYEHAQALADALTRKHKGIVIPFIKDAFNVPLGLVRSTLSFIFPFRIIGPMGITAPFAESNIAGKLKARKARADAREAYATLLRIKSLKPAFEENLRRLALSIDNAKTPEQRIEAFSALNAELNKYQQGYDHAIAPRFRYYKGAYEGGKPLLGHYELPVLDRFKEGRKWRLNETRAEEQAHALALAARKEQQEREARQRKTA